ncbi:hypothetical protein BDN71DRAFT_1514451 [Pleurotus eryngii]|uniref:BAH domain-containing protein n=1 Tax=Pleurotus eryngii TaxID=5323 RepID=A0A9P5ZF64_PLEER|nr:hypothetical protein BDN71DRAFT_1514451 [Pleurotus eryngii]
MGNDAPLLLKAGVNIYVAPKGEETSEDDGNDWWKARIKSLGKDKSGKVWITVYWYYCQEHLDNREWLPFPLSKKLRQHMKSMGGNEVVLSNHEDTIGIDTVKDICNIWTFNDRDINVRRNIGLKDFFWRFNLNISTRKVVVDNLSLHCICQKVYDPEADLQIYCSSCDAWWHFKCLDKPTPVDPFESLEDQALCVPVIRGQDNELDFADWQIAGTGELVKKIQTWGDVFPKGWKDELGEDFMKICLPLAENAYVCPKCKEVM